MAKWMSYSCLATPKTPDRNLFNLIMNFFFDFFFGGGSKRVPNYLRIDTTSYFNADKKDKGQVCLHANFATKDEGCHVARINGCHVRPGWRNVSLH